MLWGGEAPVWAWEMPSAWARLRSRKRLPVRRPRQAPQRLGSYGQASEMELRRDLDEMVAERSRSGYLAYERRRLDAAGFQLTDQQVFARVRHGDQQSP